MTATGVVNQSDQELVTRMKAQHHSIKDSVMTVGKMLQTH